MTAQATLALYPVVLDAIRQVVETADRFVKAVSVRGEMTGDPPAMPTATLKVEPLRVPPCKVMPSRWSE
ncbi:hypothetical protein G3480_20800 [Thiorhodococcus mannitoliphagus]|uniref:Uncharacterized protein n=1 Tax=Thiorhodococcus mannitoliphagus TaxID=329406 RepID=A0A6P1E523_9GAMM|nr:hypothetical protein [Thiorhodococcus mannitoliphagus]NEX22715.1 hypothetical protein [Thiorhodococcus mannitoliphagus]